MLQFWPCPLIEIMHNLYGCKHGASLETPAQFFLPHHIWEIQNVNKYTNWIDFAWNIHHTLYIFVVRRSPQKRLQSMPRYVCAPNLGQTTLAQCLPLYPTKIFPKKGVSLNETRSRDTNSASERLPGDDAIFRPPPSPAREEIPFKFSHPQGEGIFPVWRNFPSQIEWLFRHLTRRPRAPAEKFCLSVVTFLVSSVLGGKPRNVRVEFLFRLFEKWKL